MWQFGLLISAVSLLQQASLVTAGVLRRNGNSVIDSSAIREVALDAETNPLLAEHELPSFAKVKPEHARPAVESRLKDGALKLAAFEEELSKKLDSSKEPVPYNDFVPALDDLSEYVGRPWSLLDHLKAVRDDPAMRPIMEDLQPKVTAFWQNMSQSKPIYKAFLRLNASSATFAALSEARQRIVQRELLQRQLGGVGLVGKSAEEFNAVQTKLGKLSTEFSNHALDARKAWKYLARNKEEVRGIPERTLVATAEAARQAGHADATTEKGPWLLTLDGPIAGPVTTFAEDGKLREKIYRAFVTLASSGPSDNTGTVSQILKLRQKEAELLGYPNYAAMSFATKMATKEEVHKLLDDLQARGKPFATSEDHDLRAFAAQDGHVSDLQLWDRGFFAERLRKKEYDIDAEQMRVYFPFPAVVKGVFALAKRLFDVTAELADEDAPDALWHKDVHLYRLLRDKVVIGHVFIDPFSRPSQKRAGGWLQPLVDRKLLLDGSIRRPVSGIMANFAPPQDGKPALMSLGEVDTLFHEFGHALQHSLTKQNDSAVAGINGVEWDAVEIASQFMEYWVDFDHKTLYSFAKHWETGEPLPEATYQRLRKAHGFRAGTGLMSQVYLARSDLRLHENYDEHEDPNAIVRAIAEEVLPATPLPEARPLCTFSHIFAGGYAAGYYSYQWSKVLSADAFAAFDMGGALSDDSVARSIGTKFASTLLALGGGRAPGRVFEAFRGRAPTVAALLKYSGLDEKSQTSKIEKSAFLTLRARTLDA